MIEKIDAVTTAQVQNLARTMLGAKPALAALGPQTALDQWTNISWA